MPSEALMTPPTSKLFDTEALVKPKLAAIRFPLTSKFPETEALASKKASESTSRFPEIRRSLAEDKTSEYEVVFAPNRE